MTDATREPALPEIPEAVAVGKRRAAPSLVWLIPIVAALAGGWIAVKAVLEQGPKITVSFATAEGLEAGKTKIKYKNVDIGEVKSITLSEDRSRVIAIAELTPQAESFLREDTRFWVVRPRIGLGGISGISTLFSGAYIAVDIGTSKTERRQFTGLEVPPIVIANLPGRQFVLHAEDLGSLDVGSPIYFHQLRAGQVVAFELDKDGKGVTLKVFIGAPYDRYVSANTRFWHASGIDVTLDASGIKVQTQSLETILAGGIAFQTPIDPQLAASVEAKEAAPGMVFTLFADRAEAMKRPDTESQTYVLYFEQSLRGLTVGAPVDFRGVPFGEVTRIGAELDAAKKQIRMPVEIRIYPERLRSRFSGSAKPLTPSERTALLDALIERGFRAQLRTGNLLTGQLYIALDFFPNAAKMTADMTKTPPELPTVPGGFEELQGTLADLAKKLEKVPFDAIGADLRRTLQSLDRALQNASGLIVRLNGEVTPAARAALENANKALSTANRTLASDAPLSQDVREALQELTRTAQAVRMLADYLERHPEALLRGKKQDAQ